MRDSDTFPQQPKEDDLPGAAIMLLIALSICIGLLAAGLTVWFAVAKILEYAR